MLSLQSVFDQSRSSLPTIYSLETDKDCPSNKRSRCLSGPSVRLLRDWDNRRGAGLRRRRDARRRKNRGEERREEEHAVSPTPEVSGSPLLTVPYLQKASFRDSPNEHSCPHSAPQWSPPQPLSQLTKGNIAPIKPHRQWAGVGETVEVCVCNMCTYEGSSWGVSRVMNRPKVADLIGGLMKCCSLWCPIWISKKQLGAHWQHIQNLCPAAISASMCIVKKCVLKKKQEGQWQSANHLSKNKKLYPTTFL